MTFAQELVELYACREAKAWVGDKTQSEAWATCQRGDWMLWLAGKKNFDRKLLVQAACDCAELADQYLNDATREPARNALAVARAWCRDEATIEEVQQTVRAADAAVAAGAAAGATVNAARAVNAAAWAAHAADAAAYAATYTAVAAGAAADAQQQTLAQCADIVRKWIVL
jgi:hypothetical protein